MKLPKKTNQALVHLVKIEIMTEEEKNNYIARYLSRRSRLNLMDPPVRHQDSTLRLMSRIKELYKNQPGLTPIEMQKLIQEKHGKTDINQVGYAMKVLANNDELDHIKVNNRLLYGDK